MGGGSDVVEWRVFFLESAIEGISFPFFHDPPLLQSLKAARTQGNELEERTDTYLHVTNDAVGLKHRGKKGRLEVKLRTETISKEEGGGLRGMEKWVKYKLAKGTKGMSMAGDEFSCMQLVELERMLREHSLFNITVHEALKEGVKEEQHVDKKRVVGTYTDTVLVGGGDGEQGGEKKGGGGFATKLLQGLGIGGGGGGRMERERVPIKVLVEDCLLEVRQGGGREGGRERGKWRSFAVEGRMEDVQLFLSGTKLGRWVYEGARNGQAVLNSYPGFLMLLKEDTGREGRKEEGFEGRGKGKERKAKGQIKRHLQEKEAKNDNDGEDEDEDVKEGEKEGEVPATRPAFPEVCPVSAAAVAALTASTLYPIPPLPFIPYRGIKKACKLKQVSLVCVRHPKTGKFLAVEETRDRGWWLPAGNVDPGETFAQAAYRETLEEAGIGIKIEGLLRVEHRRTEATSGRMRVVFYGSPIHEDAPLKSTPDGESLRAKWMTPKDMKGLKLRSREVIEWAEYVEGGGVIYPLSLLAEEGEPVLSR